MKEKIKGIPRNMAFNVIGGIVILLALFGMILSSLGLISFTNSYKKGYSKSTFHIAETAASLVNGDHLRLYLDGEFPSEYAQTKHYLDVFCEKFSSRISQRILLYTKDYNHDGQTTCLPVYHTQFL